MFQASTCPAIHSHAFQAVQMNKNPFGLAPAGPLQLKEAPLIQLTWSLGKWKGGSVGRSGVGKISKVPLQVTR